MQIEEAIALEYDDVHVLCISPCCQKPVIHGSCGGSNFEGMRWAHCCEGKYKIVTNTETKKVGKVRITNENRTNRTNETNCR